MSTFLHDTTLYHPTEGAKLCPQGEQHPGAAWFDTPDCGKSKPTNAAAVNAEIRTLTEAAQSLQAEADVANSQLKGQAKAHAEEIESLNDAHAAALADKDAQIAGLEADVEKLVQQRDAASAGKDAVQEPAAAMIPPDNDKDGKPGGSEPDSEADKARKGDIRTEIKALGFGSVPGPRATLEAYEAALADAKAQAAKAAE